MGRIPSRYPAAEGPRAGENVAPPDRFPRRCFDRAERRLERTIKPMLVLFVWRRPLQRILPLLLGQAVLERVVEV